MTLDEDMIKSQNEKAREILLDYHLYIEFWSNREKEGERILLVVQRDFKNMSEMSLVKDKIKEALGGTF